MVSLRAHGGACCGARHLYSFGEAEERNPDLIDAALAGCDRYRMVEVILNGTQVRSHPRILERLAELGFVLDGHWMNGNHNSHNYSFRRMDRRYAIELPGWEGMIVSPGLQGDLPNAYRTNRPQAGAPNNIIEINERVRVDSPNSRHHGREMFVRVRNYDYERISLAATRGGPEEARIVGTSLRRLDQRGMGLNPPLPHDQRHQEGAVAAAAARAPEVARVVFSTFHAVFADGRRGAGYDDLAGAVANRGRRRRIDRREILSDGTTRWVRDVPFEGR